MVSTRGTDRRFDEDTLAAILASQPVRDRPVDQSTDIAPPLHSPTTSSPLTSLRSDLASLGDTSSILSPAPSLPDKGYELLQGGRHTPSSSPTLPSFPITVGTAPLADFTLSISLPGSPNGLRHKRSHEELTVEDEDNHEAPSPGGSGQSVTTQLAGDVACVHCKASGVECSGTTPCDSCSAQGLSCRYAKHATEHSDNASPKKKRKTATTFKSRRKTGPACGFCIYSKDTAQCSRTLPACDSCAGLGRKCRYHNRRHAPDTLQALGELKIRQDSSNIPLPPNWVRVIHSDIYDSLAQASLQEARSWPQIQAISEDFARADAASSAVYIILPAHIAGTKATPSPSATATPSGPIEPNWDVGSSTFSLSQDRPPSLPPNWLPLNDVWAATVLCTLGTPVHERSEWDSQVQAAYEESRGRDDGSSRFTAYALLHRFAESASVPGPLDTEPQSECGSESESESEFEVEYESEDRG